ncbi:MAG: cytochrome c oxidase assembly protein [Proteobacteria bacterium]|nr:cytochrome c oxidase assembly protein [Pseudomonadota bacterium]
MDKKTGKVLKNSVLVTVLMLGFVFFGLVPLYEAFCEFTGITGKTGVVTEENAINSKLSGRILTVQFDGTVNSNLPWQFKAVNFSMDVRPGKMYTIEYLAKNISNADVTGQAVPSVAPFEASKYFDKTECFCFTKQLLRAGEEKLMPVTFIVSSDIPEHIDVLTLSYTFFKMEESSPVVVTEIDDALAKKI